MSRKTVFGPAQTGVRAISRTGNRFRRDEPGQCRSASAGRSDRYLHGGTSKAAVVKNRAAKRHMKTLCEFPLEAVFLMLSSGCLKFEVRRGCP